ncbi:DUF1223 domain-containing protein [Pontiellaceae bacterium B12227]|nr:DUF1223 domain-containing protein [Pontiellaceae bacterium B12227]
MKAYLLITCLLTTESFAKQPLTFESPSRQVSLIELYTSEGCSSCPPAEEKLNSFADDKDLWSEFVPIAFHVDYWNYIGWHDRFSKPEFTTRQRHYSKHWKAHTIYTPCFVKNGRATRHPVPKAGKEQPGKLKASIEGRTIQIEFNATENHKDLRVWTALLSGRETTLVKSGENRGRKLEHCFVVLDLDQTTMSQINGIWSAEFNLNGTIPASAVALWISNARDPEPIQATGGWLQ